MSQEKKGESPAFPGDEDALQKMLMELGGTFDQQLKLDKDKEEVEKLIGATKKEDAKSGETKDDKVPDAMAGLGGFPGFPGMPMNMFGMGGPEGEAPFSKEEWEQSNKLFQEMMKGFQMPPGAEGPEGMSENPFLQGYNKMMEDMQQLNGGADMGLGNPEFLQQMFQGMGGPGMGGLGVGDPSGSDFMDNMLGQFSSFMEEQKDNPEFKHIFESMMKDFVSKENLYPPMKEMQKELPKWLEENHSKISAEDSERYNKQLDQIEVVCKLFEENKEDDPKHAEVIIEAINKLQEFGAPPEELIKKLSDQHFAGPV